MNVARKEGGERVQLKSWPLGLLFARVAAPRLQQPQEQLLYLPPILLHSPMVGAVTGSYASKDGGSFNKYVSSTFMYQALF